MKTIKVQTKNVKLIGGPMGGQTITVPKGAEHFRIGKVPFWTYSYAGRTDTRQEMFAIDSISRQARRIIHWYVGKHGKDPRVQSDLMKLAPVRKTGRVAHGRGAAKRRARHVQPHTS